MKKTIKKVDISIYMASLMLDNLEEYVSPYFNNSKIKKAFNDLRTYLDNEFPLNVDDNVTNMYVALEMENNG